MKLIIQIFIGIALIGFISVPIGHAAIVDNTDPGFSTAGSWGTSSFTPGYFGSNYRYASPGSGSRQATWSFSVAAGTYQLSAQWAAFDNRATNALYRVFNNGVEIGSQIFNQQINGGQFNVFDTTFAVDAGTLNVVLTDAANGYVIADAVQVVSQGSGGNLAPNGVIDTPSSNVTINVGGTVNFTGTGTDPDNDLPLTYEWNFGSGSGIPNSTAQDPGSVQFNNVGSFTVSFTVTDNLLLPDPTPATVQVTVQNPSSAPVIVDNTDPGFTTAGSWGTSSFTPGYYGSNYRYASPGSGSRQATWSFSVVAGTYQLSAQWAAFDNRATNALYRVFNNGVEIGSQIFNQQINGGQFNVFDTTFSVDAGTLNVVLTDAANGYVIADAVQVASQGSGGNIAPNGVIDTPSSNVTINVGSTVNFTGTGTDPDNDLPLTYEWNFGSGSGIPNSTAQDPGSVQFNNVGSFTVSFTVTDNLLLPDPTPATVQVTVQNPSSAPVIVDNTDPGFTTAGSWGTSSFTPGYYGSNYRYIDVSPGANSATWTFSLPEGKYEISAQWAAFDNRASNARYTILNNGAELRQYWADQRINGGQFNSLGVFYIQGGTQQIVLSELLKMDGIIIADAVRFENICQSDPCVYIQSPQDYHLQTSGTIQTTAIVQTQSSTPYGVRFVLDEGSAVEQQILDLNPPFSASFVVPLPSEMEHSIDVYLTDNSGTPVGGTNGHDFVQSVGVGNYYVGMGDSTTDGIGDDDILDDISGDFRNGGGGYAPVLNDLLTAFYNGVPHTIVNEGVPGAHSADGVAIINSLLVKHPAAQRFLLQYGINDAGAFPPVPSGLTLNPGDAGYPGTYKHNMQQMIDAINLAGREVCLAKIPIVLGETGQGPQYPDPANPPVGSRGAYVIEYNLVVDELIANPANNITISADLWAKFNEILAGGLHRYDSEYADNFHMLGVGYRSTAEEYEQEITAP